MENHEIAFATFFVSEKFNQFDQIRIIWYFWFFVLEVAFGGSQELFRIAITLSSEIGPSGAASNRQTQGQRQTGSGIPREYTFRTGSNSEQSEQYLGSTKALFQKCKRSNLFKFGQIRKNRKYSVQYLGHVVVTVSVWYIVTVTVFVTVHKILLT